MPLGVNILRRLNSQKNSGKKGKTEAGSAATKSNEKRNKEEGTKKTSHTKSGTGSVSGESQIASSGDVPPIGEAINSLNTQQVGEGSPESEVQQHLKGSAKEYSPFKGAVPLDGDSVKVGLSQDGELDGVEGGTEMKESSGDAEETKIEADVLRETQEKVEETSCDVVPRDEESRTEHCSEESCHISDVPEGSDGEVGEEHCTSRRLEVADLGGSNDEVGVDVADSGRSNDEVGVDVADSGGRNGEVGADVAYSGGSNGEVGTECTSRRLDVGKEDISSWATGSGERGGDEWNPDVNEGSSVGKVDGIEEDVVRGEDSSRGGNTQNVDGREMDRQVSSDGRITSVERQIGGHENDCSAEVRRDGVPNVAGVDEVDSTARGLSEDYVDSDRADGVVNSGGGLVKEVFGEDLDLVEVKKEVREGQDSEVAEEEGGGHNGDGRGRNDEAQTEDVGVFGSRCPQRTGSLCEESSVGVVAVKRRTCTVPEDELFGRTRTGGGKEVNPRVETVGGLPGNAAGISAVEDGNGQEDNTEQGEWEARAVSQTARGETDHPDVGPKSGAQSVEKDNGSFQEAMYEENVEEDGEEANLETTDLKASPEISKDKESAAEREGLTQKDVCEEGEADNVSGNLGDGAHPGALVPPEGSDLGVGTCATDLEGGSPPSQNSASICSVEGETAEETATRPEEEDVQQQEDGVRETHSETGGQKGEGSGPETVDTSEGPSRKSESQAEGSEEQHEEEEGFKPNWKVGYLEVKLPTKDRGRGQFKVR